MRTDRMDTSTTQALSQRKRSLCDGALLTRYAKVTLAWAHVVDAFPHTVQVVPGK